MSAFVESGVMPGECWRCLSKNVPTTLFFGDWQEGIIVCEKCFDLELAELTEKDAK